ncbi:hypothetical protein [Lichenifustis flavocetrariae]|uniref:DUF4760 domain-containing protein n=1 Tax=Lichenifustis flavocetrariae TaxID=2949735 RepID=A0AA41YZ61_9HYPH|nr:hypothetical protein [Lichenifustis flavocetrariae]MCW6511271.1 hypothetical protein [Lichenifustis flavocetrariae]
MDTWFRSLTLQLIGLVIIVLGALYLLKSKVPESAEGTLIGAGVGAVVSIAIFGITKSQNKRGTTLDLFKEYYSADFALLRRRAERFMISHRDVDWVKNDPYDIGRRDEDLAGYGAVLRFWQRVALLFTEDELDRTLIQRLLARELAHWQVLVFEPVFVRKNIYVRETIGRLTHAVANGPAREAFKAGVRDGESMKRRMSSAAELKTVVKSERP